MRALPLLLLTLSAPVFADWSLVNDGSRLSFVSIKAQDIGEVHSFTSLAGDVDEDGNATVVIQLASVDTLIPIRDERMREQLFKTDLFPTAIASTLIDLAAVEELAAGDSLVMDAELIVSIRDVRLPMATELLISKVAADRVLIATLQPIIVNAVSFNLADGVEALREVAGLPSISKAVPVSFVLRFDKRGATPD